MIKRKIVRLPESGFTLVEVLTGLVLLAVIGLVFSSALQFTGRDYEKARLLNRASRVATSEVEVLKDMAARGDFASIADTTDVHLGYNRSEEHTSELQSRPHLVCRLLLEKKKKK